MTYFLATFFFGAVVVFLEAAAFLVVVAFFGAAFVAGFLVSVFLVVTFFGTTFLPEVVAAFFGLVTLAGLAAGTVGFSFLAILTGPDGPFGCKKSPVSTPFLKALLNKESKFDALIS